MKVLSIVVMICGAITLAVPVLAWTWQFLNPDVVLGPNGTGLAIGGAVVIWVGSLMRIMAGME